MTLLLPDTDPATAVQSVYCNISYGGPTPSEPIHWLMWESSDFVRRMPDITYTHFSGINLWSTDRHLGFLMLENVFFSNNFRVLWYIMLTILQNFIISSDEYRVYQKSRFWSFIKVKCNKFYIILFKLLIFC